MLTWLRAAGAQGLDNVEVKQTAYGGLGVFLAAPVEATSIARIPVECCVTATAALTRPVGRAAREVLPDCADVKPQTGLQNCSKRMARQRTSQCRDAPLRVQKCVPRCSRRPPNILISLEKRVRFHVDTAILQNQN